MKWYFHAFILLIITVFLAGCTAAVVAGGAGGGYKAATDERSVGQMADDAAITANVNSALIKDKVVKARHIDVDTLEGHVTLTGMVDTREEAARAVLIARGVSGVKSVRNNLQVGHRSLKDVYHDEVLVGKIKSKLISEPGIRSLNIDVDAYKGVVTLTGIVGTAKERQRAIDIARTTEGTVKVVDNLTVK